MAPVAQALSADCGVVDFLQNRATVGALCEELDRLLSSLSPEPFSIAGYSFGAWLGWLFAARYPERESSLTLISSGPFRPEYVSQLQEERERRLGPKGLSEASRLEAVIAREPSVEVIRAYGRLMESADSVELLAEDHPEIDIDISAFQTLWPEAEAMRKSGALLAAGKSIRCPVTVIHGLDDPHPLEGVESPLKSVLKDFRTVRLEHCGHIPWKERRAKEAFYRALRESLLS